MPEEKKPETIADDELDAARGSGTAEIDFVSTGGVDDPPMSSSHRASGHRRVLPVRMPKRID